MVRTGGCRTSQLASPRCWTFRKILCAILSTPCRSSGPLPSRRLVRQPGRLRALRAPRLVNGEGGFAARSGLPTTDRLQCAQSREIRTGGRIARERTNIHHFQRVTDCGLGEFPAARIGKSAVFGRKCQIHQRLVVRGVAPAAPLSARISIGLRKKTSAVLYGAALVNLTDADSRPNRVRPLSADRAVICAQQPAFASMLTLLWHRKFSNSSSPVCAWPAYRRSEFAELPRF